MRTRFANDRAAAATQSGASVTPEPSPVARRPLLSASAGACSLQSIPQDAVLAFAGRKAGIYQWEQRLFDGTLSVFEKPCWPDSAYVLPVLPDGRLLLCRQQTAGGRLTVGLIGGSIDELETPRSAAKRELLEEAGLAPRTMRLWTRLQRHPRLESTVHIFVAFGCRRTERPIADPGQRVSVFETTRDDFLHFICQPRFALPELALHVLRDFARSDGARGLAPLLTSKSDVAGLRGELGES